jgi:hypothetical protein
MEEVVATGGMGGGRKICLFLFSLIAVNTVGCSLESDGSERIRVMRLEVGQVCVYYLRVSEYKINRLCAQMLKKASEVCNFHLHFRLDFP